MADDNAPSPHGGSAAAASRSREVSDDQVDFIRLHIKRLKECAADARRYGWQISDHILPSDAEIAAAYLQQLLDASSRLPPAEASEAIIAEPYAWQLYDQSGKPAYIETNKSIVDAYVTHHGYTYVPVYLHPTSLSARSAGEAPISAEADWRTIESAPKGLKVIVSVPNGRNHKAKTLMARYWPKGKLEVAEGYEGEDWAEEINGTSYMPEGWYEEFEGDDAPAHNIEPTHWRRIGPAPGEIAAVFTEAFIPSTTIPIVERLRARAEIELAHGFVSSTEEAEFLKRAATVIQSLAGALEPFSDAAGGWFMKNYNRSEAVGAVRVDGKIFTITAGHLFDARSALSSLREGG